MVNIEKDLQLLKWFAGKVSGRETSIWMLRPGGEKHVIEDVQYGSVVAEVRDWELADAVSELPEVARALENILEYIEDLRLRCNDDEEEYHV